MKVLLKILAAAAVFFIAVGMVQEWQVFASAWFGHQDEVPTLSPVEREETENALRHYLTLGGHLYRSNGDTRFLERLPATPRVTDQLMADIVYLRHNGRYQEPTMERLEVKLTRLLGPGSVEIHTREFWVIRTRNLADGTETDPVRSEVINVNYLLSKENTGWIVQAWELVKGDRAQGASSAGADE